MPDLHGDCEHCKDQENGMGTCKHSHAERKFAWGAGGPKIENGWPKVRLDEVACSEFKATAPP